MSYISLSKDERQKILDTIGIKDTDELFKTIPDHLKLKKKLNIAGPLDEETLRREFQFSLSPISFAGGGIYRHHIPAVVDALSSRQEFYTAYTPYQPEISQGTLQSIFEYQSMMASLTKMHVANASMYDGATALAEAGLMALRTKPIKKIVVTRTTHPSYREVLKTYLQFSDVEIIEAPFDKKTGQTKLAALSKIIDEGTALFVQQPNFFGIIEPMEKIAQIAKKSGFWGIVVTEAISLGLLKSPGEFSPDVVIGDAASFGNPPNAGGPLLGFFCTTKDHVRRMPGRLVGLSKDASGNQAFCLTLSTREQHIRREKATSNICSNQGLCSLRAAIYLGAMGPNGLCEVAIQCASGARHLKQLLEEKNIKPMFNGPIFNEFVIRLTESKIKRLEKAGILPGIQIEKYYPEIRNGLLVTVTEINTIEECICLKDKI
jgi:glycine dehydrogenase subunit 1